MVRAFVTGGSGFVGRNLIAVLRAQGHTVVALARSPQAEAIVRQLGAEVVSGDLSDEAVMVEGMRGCAVVYHVAALAVDWGDPAEFQRSNVAGTAHVLAAARRAGVPRLVHVSTETVLVGGRPIVQADESWPLPARPIGLYPTTKAQAERLVLAANTPELSTVIVRPRFIWGEADTNMIKRTIKSVQAGQFAWISGGRHLTSTAHVLNVCEGLMLAAERGRGGEIYFVTDGEPVEFRAFITALLRTQGVEPGNRSLPRPLARAIAVVGELLWRTLRLKDAPPLTRTTARLIGEQITVSDAKARRELGYVGKVTMAAGLAMMTARKH